VAEDRTEEEGLNLGARLGLVGGFNHLEKYEVVNGKDYPPVI
jgi:hypothetical protein